MISVSEIDGDDMYNVTGDLTIKGITHPITFKAEISESKCFSS